MIKEKLDNKQATTEKLQRGNKRTSLPFGDSAIDKITKQSTDFEDKRFKEFRFDVSKGTSLKGLLLRLSKNTEKKFFTMQIWVHNVKRYFTIGQYPNIRCKDVEKICLELAETHQDHKYIQ